MVTSLKVLFGRWWSLQPSFIWTESIFIWNIEGKVLKTSVSKAGELIISFQTPATASTIFVLTNSADFRIRQRGICMWLSISVSRFSLYYSFPFPRNHKSGREDNSCISDVYVLTASHTITVWAQMNFVYKEFWGLTFIVKVSFFWVQFEFLSIRSMISKAFHFECRESRLRFPSVAA